MAKLAVISDTHNYLDPKVLTLFEGVEHIVHAGDIGMPWLILQLENIAPVTAVMGNTDAAGLRFRCSWPHPAPLPTAGAWIRGVLAPCRNAAPGAR
jgi:predicted phosphodiesterase